MKKFSELHDEQINNYIGANKRLHEAARNFAEATEEIKNQIDKIFSESIKNQSTRSEIISRLSPIFEENKTSISDDYKEKITADWLYYEALRILSPQTIEENEKKFIVGRRRGSNGGFVITEILESTPEVKTREEEEKSIEDIEREIDETNTQIEEAEVKEKKLEKHYYPHVQKWAQENGFERCEITGGLIPGPKWENPDLIEMYFDFGKNTSSMNIEVTSFEVKLSIGPQAIWQAAHYSRFSHFTFIAFALTEDKVRSADRVFELAVKFGLGVLVLEDRENDEIKFKLIHSPTKNNPPASEIEIIVSRFLDSEKIDPRFSNAKKQLLEEKKKFASQLLDGANLIIKTS